MAGIEPGWLDASPDLGDLKRGCCPLSFRIMQRRMRLCIRVGMVQCLCEYIGQQDHENTERNVEHRCATVFASTVHPRFTRPAAIELSLPRKRTHYWHCCRPIEWYPQQAPK